MSVFNFITDEGFRLSLEGDFGELHRCLEANAWKAAHVLAGSLIEAVLIESLISSGIIERKAALQLDLAKAIERAKQANFLTAKTADLCSAIREYRNLIHPGRSVRLEEAVDENSAAVAAALVRIIVAEVSKKRLENYGYTAEQIVAKIERDSAADAILPHLLKETKAVELERLMLSVLPTKNLAAEDDFAAPDHLSKSLTLCFRTAFEQAPVDVKKKVAKRFVTVLKEESDTVVLSYGTAFFRASDLQYLSGTDVDLIRDHLFSQCKSNLSVGLLTMLDGIGAHLQESDVHKFVDPLIRMANSSSQLKAKARETLESAIRCTTTETDTLIANRLQDWIDTYNKNGRTEQARVGEEIKSFYVLSDDDIPF